jgi:NitT/TauT family transport system substrate-binding protein
MTRRAALLAAPVALALVLAACGDDDAATPATTATTATTATSGAPSTTAAGDTGVTAEGISPERCEANKAAGPITYLSGFDFAATAGIVEVTVAEEKGYFDQMCLDVDLKSSFSTANYPLMAKNEAQFASAGSYSEMVDTANKLGVELIAVSHAGKTGIDALIVKPESGVQQLADLQGKTIGVKGKITPSVKAMLAKAGLVENEDYQTVLLDGFDPKTHIAVDGIAGFPGYKSNEPGQLERAGIPFTLFDPSKDGIPGSFGVIYTNGDFAEDHPTAVVDFVRAAMRGMQDALENPDEAVALSLAKIKEGGNKNFLSDEGESFRWQVESKLVESTTAESGEPVGALIASLLQEEIDGLGEAGVFAETPSIDGTYDATIAEQIYADDGTLIWPAS